VTIEQDMDKLLAYAKDKGAVSAQIIPADEIAHDERTLYKCRYGCPAYGRYLTCPPYTPSPAEFSVALRKYKWALMIEANPEDMDSLVVAVEHEAMRLGHYLALGLKAGPCLLCPECVPPGEPCREPQKARPSMEALGVLVFDTLNNIGIEQKLSTGTEKFTVRCLVLVE
jgi:predicted metal-binding protein